MALTRDVALSVMDIRGLAVNTATSSYTLVPSDSGILCVQDYTTQTTYTLPAVADGAGKMFVFLNSETATSLKIAAPTACIKGQHATAYTSMTSKAVGDWAMVVGDGTYYYFFGSGYAAWTLA